MFRGPQREKMYHAIIKNKIENSGYMIHYKIEEGILYGAQIYSKKWENSRLNIECVGDIVNFKVITKNEKLKSVSLSIDNIIEEDQNKVKLKRIEELKKSEERNKQKNENYRTNISLK